MKNYYDNIVFITRNTSLIPSEIDTWFWHDFELYMLHLTEQLKREQQEERKRQQAELKQNASMRMQMSNYMRSFKMPKVGK